MKYFTQPLDCLDFANFAESHHDTAESIYDQMWDLFKEFNKEHPENDSDENLKVFCLGFGDLLRTGLEIEEEEKQDEQS